MKKLFKVFLLTAASSCANTPGAIEQIRANTNATIPDSKTDVVKREFLNHYCRFMKTHPTGNLKSFAQEQYGDEGPKVLKNILALIQEKEGKSELNFPIAEVFAKLDDKTSKELSSWDKALSPEFFLQTQRTFRKITKENG